MEIYFIKRSRFFSILLIWTVVGFLKMIDLLFRFISIKLLFFVIYNV